MNSNTNPPKIISVSRRTDIPAFYGNWFLERIKAGFVGYLNPFNHDKYIVSLKPEDVACLAFWSKNFLPFLKILPKLDERGYNVVFNYTITGLPRIFERNLIPTEQAVENLKDLSDRYSPEHINWRYDPIIFSDVTDEDFHLHHFKNLASSLQGYVDRCYFSFVDANYKKVKRSFLQFQEEQNLCIETPEMKFKIEFANRLAEIAHDYGISMHSCCGDYLLGTKIQKAHCIDGDLIQKLFYSKNFKPKKLGTRNECGCSKSVDIGLYNSCPHGCVYCYANVNKTKAQQIYADHDPHSAFLGYSRELPENG